MLGLSKYTVPSLLINNVESVSSVTVIIGADVVVASTDCTDCIDYCTRCGPAQLYIGRLDRAQVLVLLLLLAWIPMLVF